MTWEIEGAGQLFCVLQFVNSILFGKIKRYWYFELIQEKGITSRSELVALLYGCAFVRIRKSLTDAYTLFDYLGGQAWVQEGTRGGLFIQVKFDLVCVIYPRGELGDRRVAERVEGEFLDPRVSTVPGSLRRRVELE